jgi:hypothetical protein
MSAPPFYYEYIYIPIYLGILLKKGIESACLDSWLQYHPFLKPTHKEERNARGIFD